MVPGALAPAEGDHSDDMPCIQTRKVLEDAVISSVFMLSVTGFVITEMKFRFICDWKSKKEG